MIILPPDHINEYFAKTQTDRVRRRIMCRSGMELSIQASEFHYCSPRENNAPHYTTVEIGFPSFAIGMLTRWADDDDDPTQTVYGYVPIEVVNIIIDAHGGIDYDAVEKRDADD